MKNGFISDLRNIVHIKIKNHNKKESILFSPSTLGKDLNHCTIEEILPHLLVCSSMATIESKEKVWVATSMLIRFLATHTNNLVVMEDDTPVGMIGSREVLQGIYANPTHGFFSEQIVNSIMTKDLERVSAKCEFMIY